MLHANRKSPLCILITVLLVSLPIPIDQVCVNKKEPKAQPQKFCKDLIINSSVYNFGSKQRIVGLIVKDKIIMAIQKYNGSNFEYRNTITGDKIQLGELYYEN